MNLPELPVNLDAERFILGSIMLDDSLFDEVATRLLPQDFSVETHRRIVLAMADLRERSQTIDRVTVANRLSEQGRLDSVGGLSYLVSLDDGLPQTANLDSYIRIVKDKAALRRIIFAAQKLMDRCLLGDACPDELLAEANEQWARLADRQEGETFATLRQTIDALPGGMDEFVVPYKNDPGIRTPWQALNHMIHGLHAVELVVLAARPSMGKSVFAGQIAHSATRAGKSVAYFSHEMSKEAVFRRIVASGAQVRPTEMRRGELTRVERFAVVQSVNDMVDLPLRINDVSGRTLPSLMAELRRHRAKFGLDLVVIDYLQLMRAGSRQYRDRPAELMDIVIGVKEAAKDFRCPFLVISALSREAEKRQDKEPSMSDLYYSGATEHAGDAILLLYRPGFYKRDGDPEKNNDAFVIVAKQREGPTGRVKLRFNPGYVRFEDAD